LPLPAVSKAAKPPTCVGSVLTVLPHQHKQLFMLSTGSRRKVAVAGLLACGATITCLDQPYAALDSASIQVIRDFLTDIFVGSRKDMAEALAFAADGKVKADIEIQPLSAINEVLKRLAKGDVPSRVVIDFRQAD